MPEFNVGLNLLEQFDTPPTIEGVPVTIGGLVGRTKKGKTDKAVFASSWEEFQRKMGSFYGGFDLPKATRGFFVNDGRALWLSRVLRPEVFALLQTGATDYGLDWTARHPGAESNNINIILTDPGGDNPLLVTVTQTVSGWDIDVQLETVGASIVSTANEVLAAVNAHLDALQLVVVSLTSGSAGTGTMVAESTAPLAGGLGPSTADSWAFDSDQGAHSIKVAADNPGAWGNSLKYTTRKVATYLGADITGGANTEITINSVRDIEVGDLIIINDGTNTDYFVVATVNTTDKKLTFVSKSLNSYTAGVSVIISTATRHEVVSTINTALSNGNTQIELNNAIGSRVGSLIHINDGTNEATVLVTAVSGNVIFFDAVTGLAAPIAANSPATSFEFQLDVEDELGESETHELLSMEPTNALNYVNTRLLGADKQSELIEVTDQNPANTPSYLNLPYPLFEVALTFGLDGETPQDADYIGVATPGSETGIYRFKGIKEVSMIATPGQTSAAVVNNGINFCDSELHAMYIAAMPQSVDTVEEAIEWRDYTLTTSSMRGALYFPWMKHDDPETDFTQVRQIAGEGHIMGMWSRVATDRGFEKAPANETISGIVGLATDDKTIDWDDASLFLNPRGINIIREFPGFGIRVFGGRTLLKEARPQRFIHVTRTTIFVEQSIIQQSFWMTFEPNNSDLREDALDMIDDFFYSLWEDGVFVPDDSPDKAFYVYTGEGINTFARTQAGEFRVKFGFNVVGTAEKVIFIVTNLRGVNTIEEQ